MPPAITLQDVGKVFYRKDPGRPATWQESIANRFGHLRGSPDKAEFWGLRHIDLEIDAGRVVGVIGHNGAGKSTLLRLIGGVGVADEGTVRTRGRIGALLELGAGFSPDLSGRENVYISGVVSGLSRQEVRRRFDEIIAFSELEDCIDNPLRTYSSGMQMRLAFAVAVHTDPEILLVDEVLAVGDMAFQRKCLQRIESFRQRGCTIVIVTHDTSLVTKLCEEAVWLTQGRIVARGPADVVVAQYTQASEAETRLRTRRAHVEDDVNQAAKLVPNQNRFGSGELQIVEVALLNQVGEPAAEIETGDPLDVVISYSAENPIEAPIFGVTVANDEGLICQETSTSAAGLLMPTVHGRGVIALRFSRLDLVRGTYFVDVGAYERHWSYAYDYHWRAYPLRVQSEQSAGKGVLWPPHEWQLL